MLQNHSERLWISLAARLSAFALRCFVLLLLAVGILLAFNSQFVESYDYMGYRPFAIEFEYLVAAPVAAFVTCLLIPSIIKKPSDFFSLLYGLFVLVPYAVLYQIRDAVELQDFFLYFTVLALPLVVVRIVTLIVPALHLPNLINLELIAWLIVFVSAIGLWLAFSNPPVSAGFDVASYERRFEGRVVYPPGSLSAYLNDSVANGFAPFLAFLGAWRRKPYLTAFSLLCAVASFYLLGVKTPFFSFALAWAIGYFARTNMTHRLAVTIYSLLLAMLVFFFIERTWFGFSLFGDYVLRRALSVPPYVLSAFFDFMASSESTAWSPVSGVSATQSVTFLVGESFLGFQGLNANTNAFIYQLAAGGIPMFLVSIVIVTGVFALLDATYRARRNAANIYLGFSYASLLIEQAATTALVSSGLGVLILLTVFSKNRNRGKPVHTTHRVRVVEIG